MFPMPKKRKASEMIGSSEVKKVLVEELKFQILALPSEIILHIISFLSQADIVSKHLNLEWLKRIGVKNILHLGSA